MGYKSASWEWVRGPPSVAGGAGGQMLARLCRCDGGGRGNESRIRIPSQFGDLEPDSAIRGTPDFGRGMSGASPLVDSLRLAEVWVRKGGMVAVRRPYREAGERCEGYYAGP
ncbi:unnamed protein product [Arctogadus glacialis]